MNLANKPQCPALVVLTGVTMKTQCSFSKQRTRLFKMAFCFDTQGIGLKQLGRVEILQIASHPVAAKEVINSARVLFLTLERD